MDFAAALPSFLGDPDPPAPEEARVRVLPVPYDLTTSYQAGTRRGPAAILEASWHLEWYDEELDDEPARHGIATLPPVVTDTAGPDSMCRRIRDEARRWVDPERLLVALGGEHSITPALVEAHLGAGERPTVLQIDAHADLREEFEGSPHNHACAMARVRELGVPVVAVGIRSLTREERRRIDRDDGVTALFAHGIAGRPASEWVGRVLAALDGPVYVTIDLDGLDPSVMPATGTPEPGGLSWRQTVDLLAAVAAERRIVGADVVELMPIPGLVAPDVLAARLTHRLIGLAGRQRGW